ncbi:MAG: LysM peptidoglycan-binding domain-containing protein [Planctomycetaceae bacterium]|nr:LysM peptidoglycan-binding domain-containing protein [Planctomycetaceae bacterium]
MKYLLLVLTVAAFVAAGCNQNKAPEQTELNQAQPRSLESVQPYTPRYRGADEVAPAPDAPKPQPVLPKYINYTVQRGDTFWSIAQRTLGQGNRWKEIEQANPGVTASSLKAGQVVKIPSR